MMGYFLQFMVYNSTGVQHNKNRMVCPLTKPDKQINK